jgi:hypothetical protein
MEAPGCEGRSSPRLGSPQRPKKDDRRVVQFRVGLDSFCYFASVRLWHYDVEQNQVWPKIEGALVSLGSIVLFQHQIVAGSFEEDFTRRVLSRSLSTIRMRLVSFDPEAPIEPGQEKSGLVSRGKKSASITLFIPFVHIFFSFLRGQPRDRPDSEKPDYQSD